MPPKFFKKSKGASKSAGPLSTNVDTAKYLIIVESPSKCTKIEGFLGTEYCCIASNGHIRVPGGLKSIDTKSTFEPTFTMIEEKKDHIDKMRMILSKFSKTDILLATDDDREGEAIAWHICQVFDLPIESTPRILFHEVTKPALINAVKPENRKTINMDLVKAQHARQVLDIIVGYKISPFLWKYLYNNKSNSLSAGRCQTPALRLVYDNDVEIKTGKGLEMRYKTIGNFFTKSLPFELNHEFADKDEVLDFLEKTKTYKHELTIGSPKPAIKAPPKPLNTSRLLQTASNVLHLSPSHTMSLCQKLYQNGHITYMRTDSSQYSAQYLEQVKQYILKKWSKETYLPTPEKWVALENRDNANPHEAIRVTHLDISALESTENEDSKYLSKLYHLIWKHSIESCMADAKFNNICVQISGPDNYQYSRTIEIPTFLGWRKVAEKAEDGNAVTGMGPANELLYLQTIGKTALYQTIESTIVIRNKHSHYTEASLIHELENLGIGRPSTFATIIETIQERGYVKRQDVEGIKMDCIEYILHYENPEKIIETVKPRTFGNEKNKLVIQPTGILTIQFLLQHFQPIFAYEYTKQMEEQLDNISSGKELIWSTICNNCYQEIKDLSKGVSSLVKQTYVIEDGYEYIFEKFGPVIKHTKDENTIEYLAAKKNMNIDLERLQRREYTLEDLIEIACRLLGKHKDVDVFIKSGQYGIYVEWGEQKESLKSLNKSIEEITMEDVKSIIDAPKKEMAILRQLTPEMSIRKGKYGAYVYYKRANMKAPQFLNIKKFPEGFLTCETDTLVKWLQTTYNLPDPIKIK